ncbi:MAG: ABC transporter permease [Verrucomicrobia bacterium]|nr:ABC transporter permease [Verrucomicrobiota bacterium]
MKILATFKIALRALRRNKMRSLLTMLGIIIGVAAVITTVSIGAGAKAQVQAQIDSLGRNVILVFSGSVSRGGARGGQGSAGTLTLDDAVALKREIPGVALVSPDQRAPVQVILGNQNWSTMAMGEGTDYLEIRQWPIERGTMFTEQDVRAANKVAVIGRTVTQQLFGDANPLGQTVRVGNVPFVVIGELTAKGNNLRGEDQDDVVLMPHTSLMRRIQGTTNLRGIMAQARDADALNEIQQQMTALLRQRHRITGKKEDDFTVRTQQEIAQTASETSRVMTVLLGAIASVSLLVGGIGIMNIMLVSVTERTREIGIRMAVGAKGRVILLQFLLEAMTLSIIGGAIGIVLGVASSKLVAVKMGWPTLTSFTSGVLAFLFSAAVGIFFGFYPARKASRMDPIEALRYE